MARFKLDIRGDAFRRVFGFTFAHWARQPVRVALVGGGFLLAKSADTITLAEIIEAIEGPIAMTKCVEGHADECQLEGSCLSKPHLQAANAAVRGALQRVSLASISGTAQ